MLKLPRQLEIDPRRESVEAALARDVRPLWEKGSLGVSHFEYLPSLEKALRASMGARQLERGLEHIEKLLGNEEHGLAAAREKQGAPLANRVSRLLVLADGGSERFYRSCEAVLRRHADRVLGLRITVASETLSQSLFGSSDELVKALLVSDRDAVTNVLFAFAQAA